MKDEKGTTAAVAPVQDAKTPAPTMYREIEQDVEVPRGYVKVTEIIAYEKAGKRKNEDGKEEILEKRHGKYFCQDTEDVNVFKANNPGLRIETFSIQLQKSTAIRYIDSPENMEQFKGRKDL